MMAYFRARVPKEEGVPDVAYNASIRARACDALRGLLPAAALTNMGVFGNGRFFEGVIFKLRTYPLTEMHLLANELQTELNKVMRTFVRRGEQDHKHFIAAKEFTEKSREAIKKWSTTIGTCDARPKSVVRLVEYDGHAEEKVLASLLYPHSNLSWNELREYVRTLTKEQRYEFMHDVLSGRSNRRHKPTRAFENAYYTFDILADFGAYRDLQRHRTLTQERQDLTIDHGYDLPEEIVDAGFKDKWVQCMQKAADAYVHISTLHPKEAQYVIPFAYRVRWYFTINARALYWICELRSVPQGHPAYRIVAQEMYKQAHAVHPLLFEYAKFVDMNDYKLGRLQAEIKHAQKKH
jgi:thymidylate synthase ThyX